MNYGNQYRTNAPNWVSTLSCVTSKNSLEKDANMYKGTNVLTILFQESFSWYSVYYRNAILYGGCDPVHKPLTQEPGVCFHVETMQHHKQHHKRPVKTALMSASRVAPPSGHFMNHKNRDKMISFTSQSPTQMVAHGKLTSSHQITEVNSCVEALGNTSHIIPPLSTQQ